MEDAEGVLDPEVVTVNMTSIHPKHYGVTKMRSPPPLGKPHLGRNSQGAPEGVVVVEPIEKAVVSG